MKKIINLLVMLFVLTTLISSCIDSKNNKLIIGQWKGASWLENGIPNASKSENTSFVFDEKEHYIFTHNGTSKKGTYKVENNLLFTTEEGMQEIMVNITKLTADSLVFDMNNGGTPEQLTLIK